MNMASLVGTFYGYNIFTPEIVRIMVEIIFMRMLWTIASVSYRGHRQFELTVE